MKETQPASKSSTFWTILLKATLLSLAFATIMLFITALGVGIWGFSKLSNFAEQADTSVAELKNTLETGLETPVTHTNYKKNILLLGLDSLESRPGSPALTDTIILLSLDLKSGQISRISLPRDLWSSEYKTRINALYFYGQEKYPKEPQRFAKETIQDLTDVDIHHTIVISMDTVTQIIDILGGVKVDVQQGFTDTQFPKSNVDVSRVFDPDKLYETVTFNEGVQNMTGERVLQFIRSRKSGDDEGDDLARSQRQQLIISSTFEKLNNLNPLKNTQMLAELFKYYNSNYSSQFSIEEGVATIRAILPIREEITFTSSSLSVYPEDKLGVITNPPTYKYSGEWVYEIINEEKFKNEILEKLNL